MSHQSPLLDVPCSINDSIQSCDSPSGSSTSEPHDDSMQQTFIDQSFFYKLDQLSPDNPLYFMQQQQQQQQQQPSSVDEDESMAESTVANDTASSTRRVSSSDTPPHHQQHQQYQQQQQQPQQALSPSAASYHTPPAMSPGASSSVGAMSVVEPLQPSSSTATAPEHNQTFWSGVNSFLSNVTQNPFPQAIPNLARNFTEYLSSSYPSFNSNSPQQAAVAAAAAAAAAASSAMPTPPMLSPGNSFKTDNLMAASNNKSPGMQIRVLGVPQTGAKSRVETQIKLCIQLVTDDGDKAQWWSHIKLPEHMVAKDKLKRQVTMTTSPNGQQRVASITDNNNNPIRPDKMLFLSARVICASDPKRKVVTCLGCIQRERKRSQRRKENRIKAENDQQEEKRSVAMDDEKSLALEEQKVLLFNCSEVVDFSSGDTILPTRITCYCRHHNEKIGFCIYFEMHDHTGKQVATGMSPPIMITDDHKSNKVKAARKRPRTDSDVPSQAPATSFAPSFTNPQQHHQPMQYNFNAPAAAPPHPPMTSTPPPLSIQPRPETMSKAQLDALSQMTTHMQQQQQQQPLNAALLSTLDPKIEKSSSTSVIQSSSPQQQQQPSMERPQLQRLIPNEGPTFGGIEVTILGSNFRPGLTVLFGDVPAASTHFWSPNTLVCILPAVTEPGPVVVCFKEYPVMMDSQEVMLFTYYNENDRALMELALQVVGLKMTGKVEDAREIAMRIVQGGNKSNGSSSSTGAGGDQNQQQQQQQQQQQPQQQLERQIIQVLEVMDTMADVYSEDVSMTNAQGHTMLHLAAMLGFNKLTHALIDLGCDVDMTDRNGSTPLHYAAWFGHEDVVRTLLEEGHAEPEIANLLDKRPMHLARDGSIRTLLHNHLPLSEASGDSSHGMLSDAMSADVDTSFDEEEEDDDSDDGWIGEEEEDDDIIESPVYYSDSSLTTEENDVTLSYGMRHRKNRMQQHPVVQYLEQEDESNDDEEGVIPDAQPVHEDAMAQGSSDDEMMVSSTTTQQKNWIERTLSHFQPKQQQEDQNHDDDTSFLQHIKNNIATKPGELNLKTIADHLLQLPRPTTMIANMTVRFSGEDSSRPPNTTAPAPEHQEPEQTLAWYMALAYAMGARSSSQEQEQSSMRPSRKQHHLSPFAEPSSSSSPSSSSPASSSITHPPSSSPSSSSSAVYDNYYSSTSLQAAVRDPKRRDKRLFVFWVPLFWLMVGYLAYQFSLFTYLKSFALDIYYR